MRIFKTSLFLVPIFIYVGCKDSSQKIFPQKRDWVESVYASSKVEALNQYHHYPEVNGRLLRYFVKEGDIVKAGELIAEIDGVIFENRLQIAQSQKSLALAGKSKIAELKTQIQQSKVLYHQDSIDFERQERLFASGVGSKSKWENTRLKFEQSRLQVESLLQRFKALQEEVQSQLKQADQNIKLAKNQLNNYQVYAFRSGKVYELKSNVGELVNPQQSIAIIGDPQKFLVEMEIDERDISKIKIGQNVVVKLDAFPETYRAKISQIAQNLDLQTQTFHAQAIFTDDRSTPFYPGLTAESNIILQTKKSVLAIPINAIKDGKWIETSQGKKQIKTGLKNSQWAEVLEGIDEKTEIIIPK